MYLLLRRQKVQLTKKQKALLRAVMRGFRNDKIASTLGISERTVRGKLSRLYKRFEFEELQSGDGRRELMGLLFDNAQYIGVSHDDVTLKIIQTAAIPLEPDEVTLTHCVIRGLSNKQIAYLLELAESTIKNRLSTVFEKLEIGTRAALMPILVDLLKDQKGLEAVDVICYDPVLRELNQLLETFNKIVQWHEASIDLHHQAMAVQQLLTDALLQVTDGERTYVYIPDSQWSLIKATLDRVGQEVKGSKTMDPVLILMESDPLQKLAAVAV